MGVDKEETEEIGESATGRKGLDGDPPWFLGRRTFIPLSGSVLSIK